MQKRNDADEILENKKFSTKTDQRQYHSPHLLVLGSIQSHTAGGSFDTPEGSGKGNMDKQPRT